MYIAGIHLPNDRLTEGIVTSYLLAAIVGQTYVARKGMKTATEKAGPIKSMPTTRLGRFITPVHVSAMTLPTITYVIAVPLNGGVQPSFISRFSLPKYGLGDDVVDVLRLVGCVGAYAAWRALDACHKALGHNLHFIGVREKPKVVSTGPYALVRHPLYTSVLVQQAVLSLAMWNYVPLAALAICTTAFAIKIPIEEKLIESDPQIGPEYAEYKKKVTCRLIPGVW